MSLRKIDLPRIPRLPRTIVKSCGWGDDSFEIRESMKYLQKIEMKLEGSRVCENYLIEYSNYRGPHQSCATSLNSTTVMTLVKFNFIISYYMFCIEINVLIFLLRVMVVVV